MSSNKTDGPIPVPDLENWNTDRDVDPTTMTRGLVGKTSGGSWVYVKTTSGGSLVVNTS